MEVITLSVRELMQRNGFEDWGKPVYLGGNVIHYAKDGRMPGRLQVALFDEASAGAGAPSPLPYASTNNGTPTRDVVKAFHRGPRTADFVGVTLSPGDTYVHERPFKELRVRLHPHDAFVSRAYGGASYSKPLTDHYSISAQASEVWPSAKNGMAQAGDYPLVDIGQHELVRYTSAPTDPRRHNPIAPAAIVPAVDLDHGPSLWVGQDSAFVSGSGSPGELWPQAVLLPAIYDANPIESAVTTSFLQGSSTFDQYELEILPPHRFLTLGELRRYKRAVLCFGSTPAVTLATSSADGNVWAPSVVFEKHLGDMLGLQENIRYAIGTNLEPAIGTGNYVGGTHMGWCHAQVDMGPPELLHQQIPVASWKNGRRDAYVYAYWRLDQGEPQPGRLLRSAYDGNGATVGPFAAGTQYGWVVLPSGGGLNTMRTTGLLAAGTTSNVFFWRWSAAAFSGAIAGTNLTTAGWVLNSSNAFKEAGRTDGIGARSTSFIIQSLSGTASIAAGFQAWME